MNIGRCLPRAGLFVTGIIILLLIIIAMLGWLPSTGQTKLEIEVLSHKGEVRFRFWHTENHRRLTPAPISRLTVFQRAESERGTTLIEDFVSGKKVEAVVWQIVTTNKSDMATSLEYGLVPAGFTQIVPTLGNPPALRTGESYRVSCRGSGGAGGCAFTVDATP
jgi:hypothetical protein